MKTIIHLVAPTIYLMTVSIHVRMTSQIRRYMRYAIRRQAWHAGHDGYNIRNNTSKIGLTAARHALTWD